MFTGKVEFVARIKGNGLRFPAFEFNPNMPGVDKVVIEGPTGDEIRSTVHLTSVTSHDEGRNRASKVNTTALNRIAFVRGIAIESARSTEQFVPLQPQTGGRAVEFGATLHLEGSPVEVVAIISADQLKAELERASLPGEHLFDLFRSALLSMSPAEEFMHLYNILLMLFDDRQDDVDDFVAREHPDVPQPKKPKLKPRPKRTPRKTETDYTRLRNELAHKREGVNLDDTKAEMAGRLVELIELTKRAIESHP